MQHINVSSLTFVNKKVHSAIWSDQNFLTEVIVFALGEKLILGPTSVYSLYVEMHSYLLSILHPLDVSVISSIIDEMEKIIDSISSEFVYRSFYLSGECFLKYDYTISNGFSRLYVYSDPNDFSDQQGL